jgi:mono/diheme cytochrome c family protein/uncharacterized protein with WD repeat
MRLWAVLAAHLLLADGVCAQQDSGLGAPVSFTQQIAPIFSQKCLACHGPEKAKGGYRLDTFSRSIKPGESEVPPVVPHEPVRSELYRRLTTNEAEDRMPQKDDPLTEDQIALIRQWIMQGARFDGADSGASLITLLPKPNHVEPPLAYPRSMPVLALAFSPGGGELAANGCSEVLCWNPNDGTLLRRLKGAPERTLSLDYSPDGSLLAAAGGDPGRTGEAILINVEKPEILRSFGPYAEVILSTCFSPDGKLLAFGGGDNSIRIHATATGAEKLVIQQHADWVMTVRFSPDGDRLVSASRDRTARIYNSQTGELESTYTEHNGPVLAAVFSEDAKLICSAGRDKKIHVWAAKDAKKVGEISGF